MSTGPSKGIIGVSVLVFSTIGGTIPNFFGAGMLSFSSLIGYFIGGVFGIWIAFKLATYL